MTVIAAALRELIAAGLAGDELVAAIARIEAAQAPRRTARQERNARYYAAHKASEKRLKASEQDVSDANPPLEAKVPAPLKTQTPPPTPKENPLRGQKKKGAPLPSDWQPSESDRAYGRQLGLDNHQITDAAEEMRCWAGSNDHREVARKADWSLAFKGWLRRYRKQNRLPANGSTGPPPAQMTDDERARFRAEMREKNRRDFEEAAARRTH